MTYKGISRLAMSKILDHALEHSLLFTDEFPFEIKQDLEYFDDTVAYDYINELYDTDADNASRLSDKWVTTMTAKHEDFLRKVSKLIGEFGETLVTVDNEIASEAQALLDATTSE